MEIRKPDADKDKPRSRRAPRITGRGALRSALIPVAAVMPVADAQGASPVLMNQIVSKQNEIRALGLPGYTYDDPTTIATFIGRQCISNYPDYFRGATIKRTGSRTLKTKLTGREGMVTAGLARLGYVTSAPGPATQFDFMCNAAGTDSVKARLEKKVKGGWKSNGPWKEFSLSGRSFDVRPAGSEDPSFSAQATLKSRSSLSSSKLKAGRVRVKVISRTTTPEGTDGNPKTISVKKPRQSVRVY